MITKKEMNAHEETRAALNYKLAQGIILTDSEQESRDKAVSALNTAKGTPVL